MIARRSMMLSNHPPCPAWRSLVLLCVAVFLAAPVVFAQSETPPPETGKKEQEETDVPGKTITGKTNKERKDAMGLTPKIRGAELRAKATEAFDRGVAFLLTCQNKDGTWGTALPQMANLKNFGFGTTNKGSNDGVRHACTAIIATAFLRMSNRSEAVQASLDRAIEALHSTERFKYTRGEAFNTWGYGYKLAFLVEYYDHPEGVEDREKTKAAADVCIQGLKRYQLVDGGWNYYADPLLGGTSMSFNTANFMHALHRAKLAGLEVPDGMIGDPAKLLKRMRTQRGGFVYDARFTNDAGSVNELSSAARTAACTEGLAEVGEFGDEELKLAVEIFDEGENYLEDGRKLIMPHTAVHQVSGYFFFYGYYYLAELMTRMNDDVLGKEATLDRWERNAWTMVRSQDDDGKWWDTPAAGYGDKWGTGFALLVLERYFDAVPASTEPPSEEGGSHD